ncbi:hypothetical protein [Mesorhizobium sp. NZP2077]|uniref:hypothetical protein n=1 Tax=Mesorhizobium sp. NZP2077 TaxID=2483404 RepID=UPI0015579642|nr:hypothetical protein [Mesorhizobium sp. NZP2077]QKD13686.1 hypothetical protein HGP13_00410 [Mesorhizobium sp. NZP2077]
MKDKVFGTSVKLRLSDEAEIQRIASAQGVAREAFAALADAAGILIERGAE